MKEVIAGILKTRPENISSKATTTEGMGFTGRGEGFIATAVVLPDVINGTRQADLRNHPKPPLTRISTYSNTSPDSPLLSHHHQNTSAIFANDDLLLDLISSWRCGGID